MSYLQNNLPYKISQASRTVAYIPLNPTENILQIRPNKAFNKYDIMIGLAHKSAAVASSRPT